MVIRNGQIDIVAAGYAVVREAFNATLNLCVEKLTKAELRLAQDILDVGLDDDTPGVIEMLMDTALYSRKETPGVRRKKRAIDRIVPIVARVHDPLRAAIAARLPLAVYSVFKAEATPEPGIVLAQDIFDDNRAVPIMDNGLAMTIAKNGAMAIAGRFVDLGPWHIGFGIIRPLRKSEVVAISWALSASETREASHDALHELIYPAAVHGENLVMAALEPTILALSAAIDADMIDVEDLTAGLGSLLSDGPDGEDQLKLLDNR